MTITQQAACDFLQAHNSYYILCHAYPDGDTLGSAAALCLGLQQLGKQARMACADPIPEKFRFFTDGLMADACPAGATLVAVDVADDKLLGDFQEVYGPHIALCIDHHPSNIGYAAQTFLDSSGAANCENIYRILLELGVEITPAIAAPLYVGISTDSGCFKYANTTAETHRIAASLMETGIDIGEINRVLFDTKTKARYDLERMVLEGLRYAANDRCAMITVTRAMQTETGCDDLDMDGISSLPRTIAGVQIGITVREKAPGRYKISLRTHAPVDAAVICKQFGGGGHARAAGCELRGSLESVQQQLLDAAEEVLCRD